VDENLVKNIKKVPELYGYLGTRFTLSSGMKPHELKF
jgi:large subunit ribosomal protein L6e